MRQERKFIQTAVFIIGFFSGLESIAQIKNIKISDLPDQIDAPFGVSIAIDHKDAKNIKAALGVNVLMSTTDGGLTWKETALESEFGAAGDPNIISDVKGNFHYFHLSDPGKKGMGNPGWLDQIVGHSSFMAIEKGEGWNSAVSIGNNPPKVQVHPRAYSNFDAGIMCLTWTELDQYQSNDSTCQSNILFSKSTRGKKWTNPVRINHTPGDCRLNDATPDGALTAINIEGRYFVVWSADEKILMDRSYDLGSTWLGTDLVIGKQTGGAFMEIPGLGKRSGMPTLLADNSETFFRTSFYVTYADQTNGTNDTDIWLTRSINRGDSWSKPLKVNKDSTGTHQFMPMGTIDLSTGVVYVVYYDRRGYTDDRTDVYLAYSLDGTNHFREKKISESPFVPVAGKPFNDYIGISADNGVVAAIWTRMDEGHSSVWTAVINQTELFRKDEIPTHQTFQRIRRSKIYGD